MNDLTIKDVRAKFPQYSDMDDNALAEALHKKFYADMPRDDFFAKIGMGGGAAPDAAVPSTRPRPRPADLISPLANAAEAPLPIPPAPAATPLPPGMIETAHGSQPETNQTALPEPTYQEPGFVGASKDAGRRFVRGAAEVVASTPEALAISDALAERNRKDGA